MGRVHCLLFLLMANFSNVFAEALPLDQFQNKWSGSFQTDSEAQFYRASVLNNQAPSYIETVFSKPKSLREKYVKVQFRVSDLKGLSGLELRLSSEKSGYENFLAVSVPLFTDPDFNTVQSHSWITYTFTLGEARIHGSPDIDHIVRLGFYMGGEEVVIDFRSVEIEDIFSSSVVSFTFDDGYDDHFLAAEIMGEFNFSGTAYLMPRQINQKEYLTTRQVREMRDFYGWDLSSHHAIPIVDFTYNDLENEFFYTLGYLAGFEAKQESRHFAYPLGRQNRKTTLPLVRRLFDSARLAGGGAETLPPADWHMLRTFNVMPHLSPEAIMQRVRKAREHGEWLILMFHYLTEEENSKSPLAYNIEDFRKLCELLEHENSRVLTVNQVYKAFHQ